MLLERWRIKYEPNGAPSSKATTIGTTWPAFYKRFMVLLRALLAQLHLLPSHRLVTNLFKLRSTSTPIQYAISLPRSQMTARASGLGFAAGAAHFNSHHPITPMVSSI